MDEYRFARNLMAGYRHWFRCGKQTIITSKEKFESDNSASCYLLVSHKNMKTWMQTMKRDKLNVVIKNLSLLGSC